LATETNASSCPLSARFVQQRRFNRLRQIYNHERPHEALGQVSPAACWRPSPRRYTVRLPSPEPVDPRL